MKMAAPSAIAGKQCNKHIPDCSRLLYGILNRGEAYLIPTWLMREQRLAQVKINQSINQTAQG